MFDNPFVNDGLRLVAVFLLVLANAFFVAAEFALVSVRKTRIYELAARGHRGAQAVARAIDDPDSVIAATQLGITLSSLGLGWIGEPALSHLLEPVVNLVPATIRSGLSHTISAAIAFGLITFLHVVVGELAPKSIALQRPEATSLVVAQPTLWAESLFRLPIIVLNGAGNGLLRLVGFRPASGHEMVHSVEELKMIVSASAEGGVVEGEEEEILRAVFDFGDTLVRQVMVPRTEVIAVSADAGLGDLMEVIGQQSYTKLPVFEERMDHVIGIVHVKDVLPALHQQPPAELRARDLMRETIFVPESARVISLLELFRAKRQHMAIVLDEYGGTAGVVTLEDLLEEIVGEVSDPFDNEPEIQPLADGSSLVDGLTLIEEVNEHFNLKLDDPNYDTIAGFVLGRLGRMAKIGDQVVIDGLQLRVEAMDGRRVERLSLTPDAAWQARAGSSDGQPAASG
ncbi:MAG TPA: hemolysin family protein [Anaerolineales bacterium]|jgi:CBS domain containing-hemolysin-like protein